MVFRSSNSRILAGLVASGFMLAAAGCESSGVGNLNVGNATVRMGGVKPQMTGEKVNASDLTAYCPKVTLREGTAYFNTYGKTPKAKPVRKSKDQQAADAAAAQEPGATPADDNSSKLIYQAAITDVTRDCTRNNGTLNMNVAVAGKVVPGPLGTAGSITMPIRIVVMHGSDILYSQLHQYKLQITDVTAATQFVFNDPNINVPEPAAKDYQVFVGYDEGPPAKTASLQ